VTWQPSRPLVAAERHVDFPAHDTHIKDYQARVERAAQYTLKRITLALVTTGYPASPLVTRLEGQLVRELDMTAVFGYTHAQREIASMRAAHPLPRVRAAWAVPDAGHYGRLATQGLAGAYFLIRQRARKTSQDVVAAGAAALPAAHDLRDTPGTKAAVLLAATRQLHRSVIELVGETLNLGRTVGALRYPAAQGGPPEFAMRSEQLDPNTCRTCEELHGTITRVGSADYYDTLPPTGCSGAGRCRGIEVFADTYDAAVNAE
jgi:hypothetical protein